MAKRVILGPKLDTAAGAALRDELMAAQGEDIVLDGSSVQILGALCLELLMGAAALWRKDGNSVVVEGASPQMVENLGRYGLTPETMVGGVA